MSGLRRSWAGLLAIAWALVGVLERPQSKSADFYRELGDIFSVQLRPSNRWGGFRALRERWKAHVAATRIKPVLLIDEAQEMDPSVLSELRILASADFHATSLLTVILYGEGRLSELLRQEDLVQVGTRIRTRLHTEPASRDELLSLLRHALSTAGNATLMTPQLMDTLVDHAAGNYRLLMTMARGFEPTRSRLMLPVWPAAAGGLMVGAPSGPKSIFTIMSDAADTR